MAIVSQSYSVMVLRWVVPLSQASHKPVHVVSLTEEKDRLIEELTNRQKEEAVAREGLEQSISSYFSTVTQSKQEIEARDKELEQLIQQKESSESELEKTSEKLSNAYFHVLLESDAVLHWVKSTFDPGDRIRLVLMCSL